MTAHARPAMAACFLTGVGTLELREVAVPVAGPGEVLVRVSSVGICGSDIHFFKDGRVGSEVVTAPLVLGHECAGRIVAVGEGVCANRVGERVSLEPQKPCRHCRECKHGRYNLCPDVAFFGAPPVDGGMREFVVLGSDFAHSIGPSISDDAAALIEPFSIGLAAIRKARPSGGEAVLIAGAGPIGIMTMLAARALGAGRITIADPSEKRRAMARDLGAPDVRAPSEWDQPAFDIFVDCSGSEAAVLAGIDALRPAGTAILVGVGADRISIDPDIVRRREIVITGVFRSANCWSDAIALIERGAVDLDPLVSRRYPLVDCKAAFAAASGTDVMKVILDVGAEED